MCEIRVVIEQEGTEEVVMENVTKLEVSKSTISVTSLFSGTKEFPDTSIRHIDFLDGKVLLQK